MADLFGFRFTRIKDEKNKENFTTPTQDDGTIDVAGGGFFGQVLDTDGRERTEQDLIRRYRDIAQQPECDSAIEDIVNEGIVSNERAQAVSIVLDQVPYPRNIKKTITNEFNSVLRLLDFDTKGHDIFRRWYIDGRLFYHKVIDKKNPKQGVQELRYIDPRRIRKVREINKDKKNGSSIDIVKKINEYYIYNDKGMFSGGYGAGTNEGLKISADSITYCPSGLIDQNKGHVLSHLHKAIKPVNQLRMIEDALVIYRISRAPERRIFYIDVGNLPKIKAEQYLKDVMNRYRNKLVYDANTGEIRDDRRFQSMLEDFWLPRREGGRGTEISTLPGGENLGQMDDVEYFKKKLYRSLGVPSTRLEADNGFNMGRSSEITRDELKFFKMIEKLRQKFSEMFTQALRIQLVLKGVMKEEEFDKIKNDIRYEYARDSYFTELKDAEILENRMGVLRDMSDHVGNYYSHEFIRKKVLHQTDEEIKEIDAQIQKEREDGKIKKDTKEFY